MDSQAKIGVFAAYFLALTAIAGLWAAGLREMADYVLAGWRMEAGGRRRLLLYPLALACLLLLTAACTGEETPQPEAADTGAAATVQTPATGPAATAQTPATGPALSEMARSGEGVFNVNCSVCHGPGATGTNLGPSLIHRVYHPGHHPDFSIRNAVSKGVKQHHWWFGDMPPVAGVPPQDVENLVCYIREVQRANGVFEGDAFSTLC